jgi:hypothetical protein
VNNNENQPIDHNKTTRIWQQSIFI